jgi:hypothetical protein
MSPRIQLIEDYFFLTAGIGVAGLCVRCIGYWWIVT